MTSRTTPEAADEVYAAYGAVMHSVNWWELALTILSWWGQSLARGTGEAESEASAQAVARLEKAFTRDTAGQARRKLADGLPPAAAEDVGDLVLIRNRLAHRFLREQQLGDGFAPGTLDFLAETGGRFEQSAKHLMQLMEAAGSYDGLVRAHWPELADTVTDRLFAGEPVDFSAALRDARATS